MNITAIVNQKGGCGKTTTAINLAAVLGQEDARVLLVDMDPQGHASLGLGIAGGDLPGLYEVFKGEHTLTEVIQPDVTSHVDLVPGNITLAAAEHLLAEQTERDRQLEQHLETVRGNYDYVILDCPPALGLLSVNALRCADRVLIPVEPSLFSMDGIERLRETIRLLEYQYDVHPEVRLLANMFDTRTRMSREMLEMLDTEIPVDLCSTRIRNAVRVREAALHGAPLTDYAPRATIANDFRKLTYELMGTIQRNAVQRTAPTATASEADVIPVQAMAEMGDAVPITAQMAQDAGDAAPASVGLTEVMDDLREVVFQFKNIKGQHVQIAGEFNNWIPDEGVATHTREGALQKILHVRPGGYEYRLIIDGVWQEDPDNPEVVPNELGGKNSLLYV